MSRTWNADDEQILPRPGIWGHARFILRVIPMVAVTFGGLVILLLIRLLERPLFGARRPLTPWITQIVCKTNMAILGIRVETLGQPMVQKGALVANHASWLDIFGLNSLVRLYFVAKQEVSGWFGIGWLARATGTIFVERRAGAAKDQQTLFVERLNMGHRMLFFPEGTSTDGQQVLDFKSTLFAAFFEDAYRDTLWIQPVTQIYSPPEGYDARFFGWWGKAEFGPHFHALLAARSGGHVKVIFHEPLKVSDFADRKALAAKAGSIVRNGMATGQLSALA